jgi:hypothetical protein
MPLLRELAQRLNSLDDNGVLNLISRPEVWSRQSRGMLADEHGKVAGLINTAWFVLARGKDMRSRMALGDTASLA